MDIKITKDLDSQNIPESVFVDEASKRGLRCFRGYRWQTVGEGLIPVEGATILAQHINVFDDGFETFLLDDSLVYFELRSGEVFARVGSLEAESHPRVEEVLKKAYGLKVPADDKKEISVTFWRTGQLGASASSRTIEVDSWSDIRANYSARTQAHLDELTGLSGPPPGGRLILWHGPPGTGKTRALQTLGWEWRAWSDIHYVTDPERFFGDADYLMDVVLFKSRPHENKWGILVLEDTGELLTPDAKMQAGQGLSRLLNLTDGIIGRLSNFMLLVTTNEEVGALHPAVARPGRCAARLEFSPLSAPEAKAWLEARGHEAPDPCPRHLADLYAVLEARTHEQWKKVVGFGAA
jgi:hypothetical protein